jgi:hypothetical protein
MSVMRSLSRPVLPAKLTEGHSMVALHRSA